MSAAGPSSTSPDGAKPVPMLALVALTDVVPSQVAMVPVGTVALVQLAGSSRATALSCFTDPPQAGTRTGLAVAKADRAVSW